MFRNWSFSRRLGAGFALAGLVLAIIAVVGYRSTVYLIDNDEWVTHSYLVRNTLTDLLSGLNDAETEQRGSSSPATILISGRIKRR